MEELEIKYWDDCYGGRLGNERGTSDASDYRGRGYVQITGQVNYERMSGVLNAQGFSYTIDGVTYGGPGNPLIDLEDNPTHVNRVPELAARLLVEGSVGGHYTTRSLGDYINDSQTDFTNARRVINGDVEKNGASIAAKARRFLSALQPHWPGVFRPNR